MSDPVSPAERRAAEERLRARYEAELTRTVEITPGRLTFWRASSDRAQLFETESGAFAEHLRLEGSFPDTQFVLGYRHRLRPGREFEICWSMWPDGSWTEPDPPYDETLALDLRESIFEQIRHVHAQPRVSARRHTTYPASPEQRRAAEERLRARYEAELTKTIELGPDDFTKWPVEPGEVQVTEADIGAFVEQVRLEGVFPSSVIVVVFRHRLRPADRLAWHFGVWPLGSLSKPEPPYNDVLRVNFDEWIAANIRRAPAIPDDRFPPEPFNSSGA